MEIQFLEQRWNMDDGELSNIFSHRKRSERNFAVFRLNDSDKKLKVSI